jgi:hypothetical protein
VFVEVRCPVDVGDEFTDVATHERTDRPTLAPAAPLF